EVVDDLAVDRRAQAAEVEEQRDRHPVDVAARVAGRAAPDRDLPATEGRARDAGQVLHGLQRVALRAGDAADLVPTEHVLDGLLHHALAADRRGVALLARGVPRDLGALAGLELELDVGRVDLARAQLEGVRADRERL